MIHRANELESFEKEMFGGPGAVHFTKIVPAEGLATRARLFNIGLLRPGCAVGVHGHKGEMEIYYILEGHGLYNDNGREVPWAPATLRSVQTAKATVCSITAIRT